jgi:hypothetical protein
VFLETGDDTFTGSRARDFVSVEKKGQDRVTTGSGNDLVQVLATSGPTTVALGSGRDTLIAGRARGLVVDGGTGSDVLRVSEVGVPEGTRYRFDNRTGRAKIGGQTAITWKSVQAFKLELPAGSPMSFTGTDRKERVGLAAAPSTGTEGRSFKIDLAGGADEVSVRGADSGSIALGPGRDGLRVVAEAGTVDVDLTKGSVDAVSRDGLLTAHSSVAGVDDVEVYGVPKVTITGNEDDNVLTATAACASELHGRGGADVLEATALPCPSGLTPMHAMYGDDGDDRMTGTTLDDLLDGGPGVDTADGMEGTDVCLAETTTNCEGP